MEWNARWIGYQERLVVKVPDGNVVPVRERKGLGSKRSQRAPRRGLGGAKGGIAVIARRIAVDIRGGETGPVHARLAAKSLTKIGRGRGEDHLVKQHDLIWLELPCTKPTHPSHSNYRQQVLWNSNLLWTTSTRPSDESSIINLHERVHLPLPATFPRSTCDTHKLVLLPHTRPVLQPLRSVFDHLLPVLRFGSVDQPFYPKP